jgi:hypothetical protein
VKEFDHVLKTVYPDFKERIVKLAASRLLGSEWLLLERRKTGVHVLNFESRREGRAYVDEKTIGGITEFDLPPRTKGLVLNGPLPNFLTSRLTPDYIKHNKIFLAVSLGKGNKAVVTARHADAERLIGDIFDF